MKTKSVDIEGIGKAIIGEADDASIEEILNSIKEDIAEEVNESEDKEYHECMIEFIEGSIKGAKEANQTVAEFIKDQREEVLKEEIDCFCPLCIMKTIESVTEEDIAKYGKANVKLICDGFADTLKEQIDSIRQKINDKLRWIAEDNHDSKSYEDMTKEELIAELKKQK